MLYYTKSTEETLKELRASTRGLSGTEVEERLKTYGPNQIEVKGEPLWRKLIEPFANIFMLVLFIAAVISIFHHAYLDAAIVGFIMAANAIIYYIQRFSTERILRALQKQTVQSVEVLRDNKHLSVDANQLVPGDIVSLSEGEKIPADCRILTATSLRVDESQLTGESEAITKQAEKLSSNKEVYEQTNMLFRGSFVVSGEATVVVVATGNATEFGQLAALTSNRDIVSPVQTKIDKLISQIIIAVAAMAVIAFILSLWRGMEFSESIRFVLALSVSAVPESLPVAISVILVLGMRRMAAKKALVRNMRAIETIGVITTIATDKTGTLTKNQLTVQDIWQPDRSTIDLPHLLAHAINRPAHHVLDPLDVALTHFADIKHATIPKQAPLTSLPFDQGTAMSGNLWHQGSAFELIVKGAPEHIIARAELTEAEREQYEAALHQMTGKGYRVIAVARAELKDSIQTFEALPKKTRFEFAGFVGVADVLRPEAKQAIQGAIKAGVTVRMITGDHFETAYHIGRELGMVTKRDQVFDSRRIAMMSDDELEHAINNVRVFSRVIPEHKYRILALLKKHDITAMTGDGVNDVPALANAHVGVAMGSGASIAKDAGDIILLDDNFKHIVEAMHEGRVIFSNIRRMLFYLLSTNTGEVLTTITALILGMPVPFAPVQILWVNLITDTAMVIPLGLEPGEKSHMSEKPKDPNAPILGSFLITRMILVAIVVTVVVVGLYALFSNWHNTDYGRTIAFNALVVMQWASALSARSDRESFIRRFRVFNGKLAIGMSVAIALQLLVLFGPLGSIMHVTPVAIGDLFITSVVAFVLLLIVTESHKAVGRVTKKNP
ncbi:MAG TPA: cation-transporting P-type ATPase [Candidatus Saccharimonadales bacterium]|nr:cation-transporting P-type ATPase [Candidatus Saccharimonadales bacterium]